ncbi:hypothetical protein QZH41_014624, partial [Actinostola sp. cb2023]
SLELLRIFALDIWLGVFLRFIMASRVKAFSLLSFVVLISTLSSNASLETNEERTYRGIPVMQRSMGAFGPRSLTIRHNLPGSVVLVDGGPVFTINLNISVPEGSNTSEIQTNYRMDKDNHSIILEVFKTDYPKHEANPPKDQVVLIVSTTVAGFVVLCVLVTMAIYFCWWKKRVNKIRVELDESDGDTKSSSKKLRIPSTFSQKRRMYEVGSNPSLHVTIVVVIATICVAHAQSGFNKVDIMVEVPKGFLNPDVRIFVNEDFNNVIDAYKYKNGTVLIYECSYTCRQGSYEFSSCNSTHQAVCKHISKLPQIKISSNIIFEDLSKVDSDVKASQLITNLSAQYTVWLNRSSGIALRARLIHADFSTKYRQATHNNNDNNKFPSSADLSAIENSFCKSPIPDFYKINLKKFQELDVRKDDFHKACPKYASPGSSIKPTGAGLYCAGVNNTMVSYFGSRNSSNMFWKVEKSKYCFDKKTACGSCRDSCSQGIRNIPHCNITKEDVKFSKQKYGEHFAFCFDCCFSKCTCPSCECTKYKKECIRGQLNCVRVNQYQLLLKPVFPSSGNFKCHVEMSRGPEVVIETSLWRFGQRVYSVNSVDHNLTKNNNGDTNHDFGYMKVNHPTVLQSMLGKTVLVSGNTKDKTFKVGTFHNEADSTNSIASGPERSEIHVQPKMPFGLNSKTWSQSDCNADANQASGFVVVQDKPNHQSFQNLENLTATLERDDNEFVYKMFDNKQSHRINFEISRNRSVLRHMFPKTAIVNDDSLVGTLLRNRTFWTLRYSGRLNQCPGAFNVRMYDQDMPDVQVYNYDIAVTNLSCEFLVEFHLPSGGDTNLIDKQFLTKFTDSYKVVQLVLVSPRYKPNFDLPIINNKPDFDRLLRILLPAIYALSAAFVVLLGLLIYGYKTRPKDKMQRDRDSKLHFRHILFVVWFVGMRLIKSFLLTLTLFFIIFSAIHYSDVNTLRQYSEFRDQRQKIEKDLTNKMDEHKVHEINRQLALLNAGKKLCDEKLAQADALIDAYFKEMRRRLIEDMKEKSIIYAAYKRIEKRAREAKAKFERTRKEFNRQIKSITNEINNVIQNINNKIQSNFWLQAAKVLYRVIDAIASIFGGGLGPFIDWVGLNVGFPTIGFNLGSFQLFFDDFLAKFERPKFNFTSNINFNNWKIKLPTTDLSLKLKELRLPRLNISSPISSDRAKELLALDWVAAFVRSGVLAGILLILDIMWFVFRHSKTYQSAVVLLHGFPVVHDLDDIKKDNDKKERDSKNSESSDLTRGSDQSLNSKNSRASLNDAENIDSLSKTSASSLEKITRTKDKSKESLGDVEETRESTESVDGETEVEAESAQPSSKAVQYGMLMLDYLNTAVFFVFGVLKRVNYELTKTNLVPMVLLVIMGLLLVYIVIVTAKYGFTVDTLDTVGYFDVKMAPILVTRKIVNTRITASAFTINQVQIPYHENRVNARIAFAKKKAAFFKGFQCSNADLHNKEYCFWVDGKCDGVKSYTDEFLKNLTQLECNVPSVIPQRFTKFDRIIYKQQLKRGINPFVSAARGLVLNTFYTILIILAIFVVLRLFGEVVFIALKRFDLIRTVKQYTLKDEIDTNKSPDDVENSDSPAKETRKVGRIKVPDAIRKNCGSVRVRPGWHLEYKPELVEELRKKKEKDKEKEKKKIKKEEKKENKKEKKEEKGKEEDKS